MSEYNKIDSYLEKNLDKSLAELSRLVAQPSVGAQNWGLKECAALVGEMLKARGLRCPNHGDGRRAGCLWRTQRQI